MTPNRFLLFLLFLRGCLAATEDCQGDETCDGASSEMLLQKSAARDTAVLSLSEQQGRSSVRIVKRHVSVDRPDIPETAGKPEDASECETFYNKFLKGREGLHQIASVWMGLCKTDEMRATWKEVKDGCLYLPTDKHMEHLRDCVERPNPWHNVYFLEDLFFKAGADEKCPSAPGHGKSTAEGGDTFQSCADAEGFEGEDGDCVSVSKLEDYEASNLRIYTLDGLMGLDDVWVNMISMKCSPEKIPAASLISKSNESLDLSVDHSDGKSVTIPVKYVVCQGSPGELDHITEEMMKLNVVSTNRAFAGKDQCTKLPAKAGDGLGGQSTAYDVNAADMKIQFVYHSHKRITHEYCKQDCSGDKWVDIAKKVSSREDGFIKVTICKTENLGLASTPCGWDGLVFLNPGVLPLGKMYGYNEGHTMTHELGHYFGIPHTFDKGCKGDNIGDTSPEETSFYGCPDRKALPKTCNGKADPVHNFMDYSQDRCMCSFTEGQRTLAWATMKKCMPDIWNMVKGLPSSGGGGASSGGCTDSTSYRDPQYGDSCAGWASYSCSGYGFTPDLERHCPKSCKKCPKAGSSGGCSDSTSYRDPQYGDTCAGWASYSCKGYSFTAELESKCPKSCKKC